MSTTTTLSLHHVGEVVLRELLAELAGRGYLDKVRCQLHDNCNLLSVLNEHQVGVNIPPRFEVNTPLAPVVLGGKKALFDGAHCIDVFCHDGTRGLGIEAKLGLKGLNFSAFTKRFLGPLKLSKHKPRRITGSMAGILNHRKIHDGDALPLRTSTPDVALALPWLLVVRRTTWDSWNRNQPKFSNDGHVAIFEQIASAYGDAEAFDQLVRKVVGGGFHTAWNVGA